MKKLIGEWKRGVGCFLGDNLISFYTFFTLIFAECVYLWAFCEKKLAIQFTAILLGYVLNVIVCAWYKGSHEGTIIEVVFTIIYDVTFVVLFVVGCFINAKMAITMTVIPLCITALWIGIREFQVCVFVGAPKAVMLIGKLFKNKIFNICLHILVVGIPLMAFTMCLVQISILNVVWKIIIPTVYALCIPLFALYEDYSAALNIFELAYEIT